MHKQNDDVLSEQHESSQKMTTMKKDIFSFFFAVCCGDLEKNIKILSCVAAIDDVLHVMYVWGHREPFLCDAMLRKGCAEKLEFFV